MDLPTSERQTVSVSSAEFVRRFGSWQDRAATDPVIVTHHGRPRLVLLSASRYQDLLDNAGGDPAADGAALRLATLMDQLDSGFVAFDGELRVAAINALAATYFRIRRDAAIGRPAGENMPEFMRSTTRTHIVRTLASGDVGTFEAPAIAYPGQWLRIQTFPFADGAGLLFRNVTGERAIRETETARSALDAALGAHGGVGTGAIGQRGLFTRVDTGFAALTGHAADDLETMRLVDLLVVDRRAAADAQIGAVLAGEGARAFDSRLSAPGGEQAVRIALAPLQGDYAVEGASIVLTAAG